ISDGVSNAGVGSIWTHGWGQERVAKYLSRVVLRFGTPQEVCEDLCNVCKVLYSGKVTDDVSVAAVFANKYE
ncbi:MAG TPA: serine/threonine-protein phosphatase, partial [Bacillota bacterium]|nr:serine/threonine-protein phosphatase [Bacillota bacterium]